MYNAVDVLDRTIKILFLLNIRRKKYKYLNKQPFFTSFKLQ